jgi:PAS domain S-box-containing protein
MKDWLSDSELLRTTLDCLPIGIYILDRERRVRFWNHSSEQITGYLAQDILGQTCSGPLEHCDQEGQALCDERCPALAALRTGKPRRTYVFSLHKQGQRVGVRLRTVPLFHKEESPVGVVVAFEEGLDWTYVDGSVPAVNGLLDPATGIPSHRFTRAVLNECLAGTKELASGFGLILVRLKGLDHLRATHGPQSTTPALRTAAQTLRHALQPDNFLGQWGNDEFLATVHAASEFRVAAMADTLRNLIAQSELRWWGDHLPLAAEVAYSMAHAGDKLEDLLARMKPLPTAESGKTSAGR